jgi:hypothetical protein
MRQATGVAFLAAAAAAALLAWLYGGAAADGVNYVRITQRSVMLALTVPVCVLIGIILLLRRD